MALDHEEMKRRRQARAAQRQQRQRQWRRTMIGIGIAVAVMGFSALAILLINRSGEHNPTETKETQQIQQTQQTDSQQDQYIEDTASPTEPYTTVRLAFGGDLNVTDALIAGADAGYDYSQVFLDVIPVLADADVTALNFEGNLCGAPYGAGTHSAPQGLMTALDAAGVDMIQLANSYSLSEGLSGLSQTIDSVRSAGMEPLGVYAKPSEREEGKGFTIVEVNGLRIAYVAFTKGMDGTTLPAGNEDCVNVLYEDYNSTYQKIDKAGITAVLTEVQAQSPDYVVAMLHWGSEYNDTISASQRDICELMEANGVDAVIGTHPHYLHALEYDEETDFFAAYSLGDFLSDGQRAGTEYSIILELTVTRDNNTGETRLESHDYTPIFISTEGQFRLLRLEEAIKAYEGGYIQRVSQSEYEKMLYARERIAARVVPEPESE